MEIKKSFAIIISILFLLFSIATIISIEITQNIISENELEKTINDHNKNTEIISNTIKDGIENVEDKLNILSLSGVLGNGDKCVSYLKNSLPHFERKVGSINYFDSNGVFRCSTIPEVIGLELGDTELNQILNEPHEKILLRLVYSEFSDRYTTPLHIPVFENNQFVGSVGGAVYVDIIDSEYLEEVLPDEKELILYDDDGTILFSENKSMIGKNISSTETGKIFAGNNIDYMGNSVGVNSILYDSDKSLLSYNKIELPDNRLWTVVLLDTIDNKNYLERTKNLRTLSSFIIVFAALSTIALWLYITRKLLTPITKMTEKFEKISEGDFNVSKNEKLSEEDSEMGRLERAIDRVLVSLKLSVKKSKS